MMTGYVMDLWQAEIATARPNGPRRHMFKHDCAAPEVEFGEFASDRDTGPSPPDFLDHIVLVDREETYFEDHFVANYIGWRGVAHMAANLHLRWKVGGNSRKRKRHLAEVRMWALRGPAADKGLRSARWHRR